MSKIEYEFFRKYIFFEFYECLRNFFESYVSNTRNDFLLLEGKDKQMFLFSFQKFENNIKALKRRVTYFWQNPKSLAWDQHTNQHIL